MNFENFTPQLTADGSFTFLSQEFGELFHSHYGAKNESFLKFALPTQLAARAQKQHLRLLDVCYGLGYNTAAALQTIWAVNPACEVEVIGLELNLDVPQAALAHNLFDGWEYKYKEILTFLAFEQQVKRQGLWARLLIGDARSSIYVVRELDFLADAIFLDPFSPPQCPQLWTVEFIHQLSLCLEPNGLLATYSCAAAVRTAFLAAQLRIGSTAPVGRRAPGTIAALKSVNLPDEYELSSQEKEHLLTRAAVPYRDPQLTDSAQVILQRREQEQKISALEHTKHWRKRWQVKQTPLP